VKEAKGDLWTWPADWRVITTNGFVKKNGECVMGRGCAKEAALKNPKLPKILGDKIKANGNVFQWLDGNIFAFPVKHNWWEKADLELIKQSARELEGWADDEPNETFLLPRPGCGNGQLKWEDVKPLLKNLPDNVTVITHE
jgi:hypothetical protein